MRPFFAARGDVIIHASSEPDGIYFIRAGLVQTVRGKGFISVRGLGVQFRRHLLHPLRFCGVGFGVWGAGCGIWSVGVGCGF